MPTELAVDATDQFVNDGAQVLVLLHVLTARYGNLNEHNLANPLRVLSEEDFQSMKFLRDAFDVIKAVHTNDELYTLKFALKRGDALLNFRLLQAFSKLFRIDTNRKRANGDDFALVFNSIRGSNESTTETLAIQISLRSPRHTNRTREQLLRK